MHKQRKWRNTSKQWIKTIDLLLYTKENSCPLYPPITWRLTAVWRKSNDVRCYLQRDICLFFVCASHTRPPTNHHRGFQSLEIMVEVEFYWSLKCNCYLRRSEAAFDAYCLTPVFEWPCPPSTPRALALFIDFWWWRHHIINQSDCRILIMWSNMTI